MTKSSLVSVLISILLSSSARHVYCFSTHHFQASKKPRTASSSSIFHRPARVLGGDVLIRGSPHTLATVLPIERKWHPTGRTHHATSSRSLKLRLSNNDEIQEKNTEDDGWGNESGATDDKSTSNIPTIIEPRRLSQAEQNYNERNYYGKKKDVEPERDLFIPIFAMVSLVGFGGLYGYETLRLYLNGELYLPFSN